METIIVESETLSDSSVVWNVSYVDPGNGWIYISCIDKKDAELLAECLNNACAIDYGVNEQC